MATFETYSRKKKGLPDVLSYHSFSEKLKTQIYHIWNDYFLQDGYPDSFKTEGLKVIHDTICKETGKKTLFFNGTFFNRSFDYQIEKYFESLTDIDALLDTVDIIFYFILRMEEVASQNTYPPALSYSAKDAILDLNTRFKEHGIGYEFANKQIIRIDNQLLHQVAVVPTLSLIQNPEYSNVNDEYLKAHEHYRYSRNQECLNECLKSFETTIKIICFKNNWPYQESDTANVLVKILITNKFLPSYNENQLNSLRSLLQSNIPTVRNKNSAHGQGTQKRKVPNHLAQYLLSVTGATIQLLINSQTAIEKK
jgi:hypothetical protein